VTIYCIATNQDAPLSSLSVYQISRQSDNVFVFITTLTPWLRKNEETQPIFKGSYLGNAWHDLVEIWNVRWWCWSAFLPQKLFVLFKCHRATYMWKLHYFSPVNNSQVWSAGFLGRMTHYHVSWFVTNCCCIFVVFCSIFFQRFEAQ